MDYQDPFDAADLHDAILDGRLPVPDEFKCEILKNIIMVSHDSKGWLPRNPFEVIKDVQTIEKELCKLSARNGKPKILEHHQAVYCALVDVRCALKKLFDL